MAILTRSAPRPAEVSCVREVRVGIPVELCDDIQRFYEDLLGLAPWPQHMQVVGGWGLGNPQCGLYLEFRHDPQVDPVRRRFTLTVDSLDELAQRLAERQWPYERIRGFGVTDQCILVRDPVGHIIEVRQSQPL